MAGVRVPLCHQGWICATGGSANAHQEMYALFLRGHSAADVEAQGHAAGQQKLLLLAEHAGAKRSNRCRDYAVCWWLKVMRLQDYMPNDNKLVLRGPGYGCLHKRVYLPAAVSAGLGLSYKTWMSCIPEALRLVGLELQEKHGDMDANKLRFGRCEKQHSKFAECTACQELRENYLRALSKPTSSPEFVQQELDALLAHRAEWSQVCLPRARHTGVSHKPEL